MDLSVHRVSIKKFKRLSKAMDEIHEYKIKGGINDGQFYSCGTLILEEEDTGNELRITIFTNDYKWKLGIIPDNKIGIAWRS